jgi:hypothetical protein
MQIPLHYAPRNYQAEGLAALEQGVWLAVWCWARRGGKDMTAFAYGVRKMVESPMNVVLVFPTKEQGRKSFWNNVENDGFKTIDHIPQELIANKRDEEMFVRLRNGSTFQILGATDPEALRGANGKLYIFSEFVDIDVAAFDVVRPIVVVNGGQIIIQSTPKIDGISGATFKAKFDKALKNWTTGNKTQFASIITAHEYLDDDTMEELRLECIEQNGNDFFYRQEFLCDWGQASSTSYYGHLLQKMGKSGQIATFPYVDAFPAYTAWDLGMADSMAITFFQYFNKRPRIIDYYETHNLAYEPMVQFVMAKPYNFAWHFWPHDGSTRDSDAIERIEKVRNYGLVNSSLLRKESKEDGIKRVASWLPQTDVNEGTTDELRRKLTMYKRKFNPLTGDYVGPEHKSASHAADSVRYMYKAIEDEFDPDTGRFYYADDNLQTTYESVRVATPAAYRPRR